MLYENKSRPYDVFKKSCQKSLLLMGGILFANSAHATYLDRKAEGWHFYEERGHKKRPLPQESEKEGSPSQDPIIQLKSFKEKVARAKAQAVMSPTFENVRAYMTLQKHLMNKASRFAHTWMEVVYTTPQLDYTLKHPTSQAARHVYLDEKKTQRDAQVRRLAKTHGLFFFFSRSCPYCKHFAPIVKAFSKKYGWKVMAISMDGSSLPEFPKSVRDNGTAQRLGVQFVPTLLAVNPTRGESIPLSYGMSSQDQILDRIRVLIVERKPS